VRFRPREDIDGLDSGDEEETRDRMETVHPWKRVDHGYNVE
jgi:hypothetical protein